MKKPYIHTIVRSYGKECVLTILFQLYGSKAGLFDSNLFWVGHCTPPTFILEEQLIQYLYNSLQFLSNLSKIIPSQETADIIL